MGNKAKKEVGFSKVRFAKVEGKSTRGRKGTKAARDHVKAAIKVRKKSRSYRVAGIGEGSKTNLAYVAPKLADIYQLSRDGYRVEHIAQMIGISYPTFLKWRELYPCVQEAVDKGRRQEQQAHAGKFKDYIHDKLPDDLTGLWDRIMLAEETGSKAKKEKVKALLANEGKVARQQLFVFALVYSDYNPSKAMSRCQVRKKEYEAWLEDPQFAELVEEVEFHKKNFFEEAVIDLVKQRDPGIVRFAAQTQLADRGYAPKKTVDKNVRYSGEVRHKHVKTVRVADLAKTMTIEERRKLLDGIRAAKEAEKLPPRLVETVSD